MISPLRVLLVLAVSCAPANAQEEAERRFSTLAVCVDAGAHDLAAWQVTLAATGPIEIVGIEGGHTPFAEPAHYDPAALGHDRVVLAGFTTEDVLRDGVQQVATLHVMGTDGGGAWIAALEAAGDGSGARIDARVWVSEDDCGRRRKP